MTDMKWKRLSFCGPGSWSEILAVGEMADDKRLLVWAGIAEVQVLLHFFFFSFFSRGVWSCFLLSSWTSLQQQALNLTMNLTSSISLFVTFSSSKWSSEPVGHCWYVSHCPCSFRMSIRNRPQSAQCQWVTYVSTVSPITHRLHSILPPSLFFLSHSPLLYAHTHAIPPCAERWMGCSQPQVLLYLWVFLHSSLHDPVLLLELCMAVRSVCL